jgi:hypothetical protein
LIGFSLRLTAKIPKQNLNWFYAQVAWYYAWLGFYTKALVLPSVLGKHACRNHLHWSLAEAQWPAREVSVYHAKSLPCLPSPDGACIDYWYYKLDETR